MIKGFADKETGKPWKGRKSKAVPARIRERALAKLTSIEIATNVRELEVSPGKRLENPRGDREGQWSIRVNQQYRVRFRFEGGDALDVEVVDYH